MNDCCKDYKGNLKKKYATFEAAEEVALARRSEGIKIGIYECFERDGYHLTSHGGGDGTETEKQQLIRKHSRGKQRIVGNKIHQKLNRGVVSELLDLRDLLRNERKPRR